MKNRYDFDKSIDRRMTHSYKWEVPSDYLSLSIADTDFMVPTEVREAIKKRADQSTYGYTYAPSEYYEAYIYWWKHRYNTDFKKEWFTFSASIVASIDSIIKRLTNEGDYISLFSPNYNVFYSCIENNKRKAKEIPFSYEESRYFINFERLEEGIKGSKIFILCNPHNPIGKQFTEKEIKRIASICEKYHVYLLSDEIHADLDYNESRYVPAKKVTDYDKLITLLSPGKIFNLAGLHSSVVVTSNPELKSIIEKGLREDDVSEPSYFSIEPVIEAYTKCEEYVNELNDYILENKRYIINYINANNLKLVIVGGNATYLLWIDISAYSNDSEKFVKDFEEKEHVKILSGNHYREFYSSFVRVNIATQKETVKEFMNRLNKYLKENY